jgi:hypothetical protein
MKKLRACMKKPLDGSVDRGVALAALLLTVVASTAAAGELWVGDGGAVCLAPLNQTAPRGITNGAGGFLVVWQDDREMGGVFLQSVSREGMPRWMLDGISPCHMSSEEFGPVFVSDDEGGAIVAWIDMRSDEEGDVYAQRVRANGEMAWQTNGVPVCATIGDQWSLSICPDGAEGAIIAWWDDRAGSYSLYAQRVDASGAPLWQANGVVVCGAANFDPAFLRPAAMEVPDGQGGIVIAWEDFRSSDIAARIYAQRLDGLGAAVWQKDGVAVCDAPAGQWSPAIVADGNHGAIVTWHDFREGESSNIYAQQVSESGELVWAAGGLPVCEAADDQFDPEAAPDGAGGAVIAWTDLRSGTSHDIYAQRVSSSGEIAWLPQGVPLCAAPLRQSDPALVPDGAGGAIAAWHSFRGSHETDIWANKVLGDGSLPWQPDGVPVCTLDGLQRHVAAVPDGEGGAFFAWEDGRSGNGWDVYALRECANGAPVSTLLRGYEASAGRGAVLIEWTLSLALPESSFEITRSDAGRTGFVRIPGAVRREGMSYRFLDGSVEPGKTYVYCAAVSTDGASTLLFETGPVRTPLAALALEQNHPNPFHGTTVFGYDVPSTMNVDLSVFSCDGALVAHLYRGTQRGGHHEAAWSGTRDDGTPAVPGVYYCTLKGDHGRATKKLVLIR